MDSTDFVEFFEDENPNTDALVEDCINFINKHEEELRAESNKYRLDEVLRGMMHWAPSSAGKRYAAVALYVAIHQGFESVKTVAQSWVDNLLVPIFVLGRRSMKEQALSVQTPLVDETALAIQNTDRTEQQKLHALVGFREEYCCAISRAFDFDRVVPYQRMNRAIPPGGQQSMNVAHILSLSFDGFDEANNRELFNAATFRDLLKAWTSIDIHSSTGSSINTPRNYINMTRQEHYAFGRFEFILTQSEPEEYNARMLDEDRRFSNGLRATDVTFPSKDITGVDPPDPYLIAIHAAFGRILHHCGVAEYFDDIERQREGGTTLRMDGKTDFGAILQAGLMVPTRRRQR
ncbi:hypothetical protein DFH06DRAFT_1480366 [Mycena polygramma]|nr:hypothetical protein DFH06DRAFT_1480366 [Mycena polygramma]